MVNRAMDFELAAELVANIEARVGRVGEKSVNTSSYKERYGAVALSRGGIVTPGLSYEENYTARRRTHTYKGGDRIGQLIYAEAPDLTLPVYRPELAVVKHHVGVEGEEGLHYTDSITLSSQDSREYVFTLGEDGLWRAYDAFGESSGNYWTQTTEYFLDAARLVESNEEGLAIRGLIVAFDEALVRQSANAVKTETGFLPQGQ
jgi:hypothetical protein